MTTQVIDETRTAAFAGRMIELWNEAFLSLMISIGHQTQLFDMMAELPPSTSEEIARRRLE